MVRDRVPKILQRLVSERLALPRFRVAALRHSAAFTHARRASLFLGMSDGARIDQFRRNDATLSNEQFAITYELSAARAGSMLKELRQDLGEDDAWFDHIFLVDDFAGSGRTIIRHESDGSLDGRLVRFVAHTLPELKGISCPKITICLYLATDLAVSHIEAMIADYPEPPWERDDRPQVVAVMRLGDRMRLFARSR